MKKQITSIHLDELRSGEPIPVDFSLDPQFLEVSASDDIRVLKPISVQGECSLVEDFVLLNLSLQTVFSLPCSLCNDRFDFPVNVQHFRHEELVQEIKHSVWDFGPIIREAILLEIPFFPLCGGKECLNRKEIEKYFSKHREDAQENTNPFQKFFEEENFKKVKKKGTYGSPKKPKLKRS